MINQINNFIKNDVSLITLVVFFSILPKIGFEKFSLTFTNLFLLVLSPFILLNLIKFKKQIFKDIIFLLFISIFISCLLSLILNGIYIKQNLFNIFRYFEIFFYLLIYLNAKYIVNTNSINHHKILNVFTFIALIFFYVFILKIFEIKTYLSGLNFDLLLSDYKLKLNGLNDFTINILSLNLITKGTTSTNLSYVFCFINVYLAISIFNIKDYSYKLLFLLNVIFIIYSFLVFHNTIYLTFIPILLALSTIIIYRTNFLVKLFLFLTFLIISYFIISNVGDLGIFNKITNVIETSVKFENPRIKIWSKGIDLVSSNYTTFLFGLVSPELYSNYDFFESLFIDSFVKYGLIHLLLITILITYIVVNILNHQISSDEKLKLYYLVMLFLTPSLILNNLVNSNMLFSELFAPIFFHIFGIINKNKNA